MYDYEQAASFDYSAQGEACAQGFAMDECADMISCELDAADMESRGRIVELTVRLHDVCPGKRTALGVVLHETDGNGNEEPRGMKAITVPAHNESGTRDIVVRHIRFVLPEDLSMCTDGRQFIARTTAHYIDLDIGSLCPARRH